MTLQRLAAAAAFAFASSIAFAQAPAPAAAAAPTAAEIAAVMNASKCEKPDAHPGRLASPEKMRGWNRSVQAWQECMKTYISGIQAKADTAVKAANAAVAESNNAVNAYNAVVKDLQGQADAAK